MDFQKPKSIRELDLLEGIRNCRGMFFAAVIIPAVKRVAGIFKSVSEKRDMKNHIPFLIVVKFFYSATEVMVHIFCVESTMSFS